MVAVALVLCTCALQIDVFFEKFVTTMRISREIRTRAMRPRSFLREILTFQAFSGVTAGPHRESQKLDNSRQIGALTVIVVWCDCRVVRLPCGVVV